MAFLEYPVSSWENPALRPAQSQHECRRLEFGAVSRPRGDHTILTVMIEKAKYKSASIGKEHRRHNWMTRDIMSLSRLGQLCQRCLDDSICVRRQIIRHEIIIET